MAWSWLDATQSLARGFREHLAALRRFLIRLFLGRRFSLSLERNREAAERLDATLKELFPR